MVASFAGGTNKVGNGFGVFFLFLYAVFYGGCLDASSYVYVSEIFPTAIRTRGVGFSVSGLFLSNLGESPSCSLHSGKLTYTSSLQHVSTYCLCKYWMEVLSGLHHNPRRRVVSIFQILARD